MSSIYQNVTPRMSYHQSRVATKLSLVREQMPLKTANSVTLAQADGFEYMTFSFPILESYFSWLFLVNRPSLSGYSYCFGQRHWLSRLSIVSHNSSCPSYFFDFIHSEIKTAHSLFITYLFLFQSHHRGSWSLYIPNTYTHTRTYKQTILQSPTTARHQQVQHKSINLRTTFGDISTATHVYLPNYFAPRRFSCLRCWHSECSICNPR